MQRQLQRGMAGLARAIAIEALALTSSVAGGAQVCITVSTSFCNHPSEILPRSHLRCRQWQRQAVTCVCRRLTRQLAVLLQRGCRVQRRADLAKDQLQRRYHLTRHVRAPRRRCCRATTRARWAALPGVTTSRRARRRACGRRRRNCAPGFGAAAQAVVVRPARTLQQDGVAAAFGERCSH